MSSEDWGFDPYADIMEAFGARPDACRFCKHAVATHHNNEVGCTACTCMATQGEARPQTSEELDVRPFSPNHIVPGYAPRRAPIREEVDCGVVSTMGLPRAVVGRCIGAKGHRSKTHSFRPVDPSFICGHPHSSRNEWCDYPPNHSGNHRFAEVPSEYVNHTAPRKDADMKNAAQLQRELDALAATEAMTAARRRDLEEALALRNALPTEPAEGSIIKFRVQFDANGITYEFVAFRTRRNSSAQWYTTGSNTKHKGPHSWDDLLNLMQEDHGVKTEATKLEFFLFDESGKWVR